MGLSIQGLLGGGLLKTHVGAIAGLRREGNLERLSVIIACSAAHRTRTHTGWIQEKIAADVCFSPLCGSTYGRIFPSHISRMHWEKKKKLVIQPSFQIYGCCWRLVHFRSSVQAVPSCAAMCSGTAVARGPLLVRYCSRVTHLCARPCARTHTHTHVDDDTHACESACTQPPFYRLSQKSHVLQEPRRGGGEKCDKL